MKVLISKYVNDKTCANIFLGEDALQSRFKYSKHAANIDIGPMRVERGAARMSRQLAAARSGSRRHGAWARARDAARQPRAAGSSCSKPVVVRAGLPDYPRRWQTGVVSVIREREANGGVIERYAKVLRFFDDAETEWQRYPAGRYSS